MNKSLEIRVVPSALLSVAERESILALCNRAYEEDMGALFETFPDPVHVIGSLAGEPVSHALWVTRFLQVGEGPLLRTAYVEAVATDPSWQRRGFASAIMRRVAAEVREFDLAALSPFSADYYARLGWELWQGPLFIRTPQGRLPSPEDEQVMILRLPRTPPLDLTAPLSAEWRPGELW